MTDPNVLLVVLDSVRAHNTTLHGHRNDTTPFLRSLVDERATHYEQARAPGVWSLPSHTSIFTGYHVAEHGLVRRDRRLAPGETVWSDLSDEGYETGLFTDNPYLTELSVGLDEGFDTVVPAQNLLYPDALNPRAFVHEHGTGAFGPYLRASLASDRPLQSVLNGIAEKVEQDASGLYPGSLPTDAGAEVYADRFLAWEEDRDGPWAACINFMDAHTPYTPGEHDRWGGETARRLQDEADNQIWEFYAGDRPQWHLEAYEALYDGAIRRIDDQIRRIVQTLESRGRFEDTLLVVTSDHGEGFGEPSRVRPDLPIVGHQARGIHESLLHVPLVVHRPGQTEPRIVDDAATLTRFPTLVETVRDGGEAPAAFVPDGPVVASSNGLDEQKRSMASQYVDDVERFQGTGRAVYETRGHSLEKAVTWDDLAVTVRGLEGDCPVVEPGDPERVDAAFDELRDVDVVLSDGEEAVGGATRERLEDLGYV